MSDSIRYGKYEQKKMSYLNKTVDLQYSKCN